MSRYNCTLQYKEATPGVQDLVTGFWGVGSASEWLDAGYCHIEKHTPPKEIKGVDGNVTRYVYEIFLPISELNLSIGSPLALFSEEGVLIEEVIVTAIDNTGRKHMAIWA